jgi:uncharacterized protein YndB with AHSA1/START domain
MQRLSANDQALAQPPDPVFRTLVLPVPRPLAFDLFTTHAHRWWSPVAGASPTGALWAEISLETHLHGRWFELDEAGEEHEWGVVVAVNAPERIVIDWRLKKWAPDVRTELELCFIEIDQRTTRMTLEHRTFEASHKISGEAREAIARGWNGLLPRYASLCGKASAIRDRVDRPS